MADELNTHAAKSEDVHLDQATRDYHLGACWAWYLHLSPRTGICYLQSILTCVRPSSGALCQGRVGRRPQGRLGVGDSPTLLSSHPSLLGTSRAQSPSPASGKVPLLRFGVCTHVRPTLMEPSSRHTQHGRHSHSFYENISRLPRTRAGMHWVREEGFQGLRTLSVETGEQLTCPLCRQVVQFTRTCKRGA